MRPLYADQLELQKTALATLLQDTLRSLTAQLLTQNPEIDADEVRSYVEPTLEGLSVQATAVLEKLSDGGQGIAHDHLAQMKATYETKLSNQRTAADSQLQQQALKFEAEHQRALEKVIRDHLAQLGSEDLANAFLEL